MSTKKKKHKVQHQKGKRPHTNLGPKIHEPAKSIPKNFANWPLLILLIMAFGLYIQTVQYDYALDDQMIITNNDFTQDGLAGIPDVLSNDAFTGFFGTQKKLVAGGRYRPLSQLMFATEYEIFGNNPFVGHLVNVLLYVLTAYILYCVLMFLFQGSDRKQWYVGIPFLAALFFIVHPLHTEAVANIKGRDEILSVLFSLWSLYFVLHYTKSSRRIFLLFSGIMFLLGLLSKENTVTFLAVVPLTLFFFTSTLRRNYLYILSALLVSFGVYLILRYNALGYLISNEKIDEILNDPYAKASFAERHATNFYTWLIYLKLMIFPHPLTHDYYPKQIPIIDFGDVRATGSFLMYVFFVVLAFVRFRKKEVGIYGLLVFLLTFSISSNLIFNVGTFMNERFLYMPLIGAGIVYAVLIRYIAYRMSVSLALVFIILLAFAFSAKTIQRNTVWKNDFVLFTTDVKTSVNSTKCNVSAGGAYLNKALQSEDPGIKLNMLSEAEICLTRAVDIHPANYGGWHLLGNTLREKENYQGALIAYQNCLVLKPAPGKLEEMLREISLLAHKSYLAKDYASAEKVFNALKNHEATRTDAHISLADIYASTNRIEQGIMLLHEVIKDHPYNALAYNKLGKIYGEKLQNIPMSLQYLSKAYELNPEDPSVMENLGIVHAILGNYPRAIELFRKALEKNPNDPRIMANLINVYRNMGNKKKAEELMQQMQAMN